MNEEKLYSNRLAQGNAAFKKIEFFGAFVMSYSGKQLYIAVYTKTDQERFT